MKIHQQYDDDRGAFVILPELNDKHTLREMAIALIIASYDLAVPLGYGFYRDHKSEMTEEFAKSMLEGVDISHDYGDYNPNKKNEVHMDYVNGRCCKTYLKLEDDKQLEISISPIDRKPKEIIEYASQLLRMKDE